MGKSNISENELSLSILKNLRKIIRAIDLDSKKSSSQSNLTTPQILSLAVVDNHGPITLAEVANHVHLGSSTMVGIIDRLEAKGLLKRERSIKDRRQVFISITKEGEKASEKASKKAPTTLQDKLMDALGELSENQQKTIVKSLNQLVTMLGAETVKAAPILISQTEPS